MIQNSLYKFSFTQDVDDDIWYGLQKVQILFCYIHWLSCNEFAMIYFFPNLPFFKDTSYQRNCLTIFITEQNDFIFHLTMIFCDIIHSWSHRMWEWWSDILTGSVDSGSIQENKWESHLTSCPVKGKPTFLMKCAMI